jgi:YggT family protein
MMIFFDLAIFLLTILWWVIVVQVILSWLVAFNVVNLHQSFVRSVFTGLEKLTAPMYRPIRKILPDFGGLDFSPLIILVTLSFVIAELNKYGQQLALS